MDISVASMFLAIANNAAIRMVETGFFYKCVIFFKALRTKFLGSRTSSIRMFTSSLFLSSLSD